MMRVPKIVIVFLAILLAIFSYYFFVGWFNVVPWAIFALIIGYTSSGYKDGMVKGALFGYFLFITYILIGYKGNMDKAGIFRIILFSIFFSLIGAVAGAIGSLIGYFIRLKNAKISI